MSAERIAASVACAAPLRLPFAQRNNLRGFAKPDPVEGRGDELGGLGALVDYLGAP